MNDALPLTPAEAAEKERHVLLQNAMNDHLDRIETETRRYRADVAHIEHVYRLRLGLDKQEAR